MKCTAARCTKVLDWWVFIVPIVPIHEYFRCSVPRPTSGYCAPCKERKGSNRGREKECSAIGCKSRNREWFPCTHEAHTCVWEILCGKHFFLDLYRTFYHVLPFFSFVIHMLFFFLLCFESHNVNCCDSWDCIENAEFWSCLLYFVLLHAGNSFSMASYTSSH
jgi:hypothetical protein